MPSLTVEEIAQVEQLLVLSMNDLGSNYNGRYNRLSNSTSHMSLSNVGSSFLRHLEEAESDDQLIERSQLDRGAPAGRGVWVSGDNQSVVWLNHAEIVRLFAFEQPSEDEPLSVRRP